MTPAPTIVSVLGTSFKAKAPVEDTIRSSSNGIPGKGEGSDPVAINILAASIVS